MVTNKHVKASDIVIKVKDDAHIEDDACRMSICHVKCIHYQTLKWEEAINMVRRMEDTEVILWTFIHEEAPTTYHVDLGSMLRLTVSIQFGADMFDVTVKGEASNG